MLVGAVGGVVSGKLGVAVKVLEGTEVPTPFCANTWKS